MPLISDSIGRVLGGRYRLVSALGTGASAHVFLAEDVSLRRRVAVKVLLPQLARDPSFLKRFGAEARSVAALNHPYILQVYDWGEDVDGPYLVLEYLHGGSLRDVLDRGFLLSQAQAAQLGVQAAQGLAYAHARGLVHRDVKPANLLFDEEGRVRVADFGVARALAEAAWTEPAGAMIGTARYASPEQAQGLSVDGRADVYSLALVLYEAMTGEVPFVADTTVGTLMARVGAPLPRHPALGTLDDVLARAAAPEVEARLDAAGFAARLEAVAATLAPPAPLPLALVATVGMSRAEQALAPDAVQDLTAVVPAPAPAPVTEAASATAVVAPTAAVAHTAAEPYDHAAGSVPPSGPPVRQRQRRPWWPWAVGAVAVLVVVGLVVAFATDLFTPSHPVPNLIGKTLDAASQAIEADHFKMVVGTPVDSTTVGLHQVAQQSPAPGVSLKQGASVTVIPSGGLPTVTVPSLSGMNCARAEQELTAAHLKAKCPAVTAPSPTIPVGQVINWSYDNKLFATSAPWGSTITIAVSTGKPPVAVPTVAGATSFTAAKTTLANLGLGATQAQASSTTVPKGKVIGTTPPAGQQVPVNSTVTVTVSTGPPMVTVPTIKGMSMATATAALKAVGLVGRFTGHTNGKVATFTPSAGQSVVKGSTVTVFLK